MPMLVATCSVALSDGTPEVIKLMPLGDIHADDGRAWRLEDAEAVVAASLSEIDLVIDYEHQTDYAKANGQPAIAAGWIKQLERRGDGIYGHVEWTEKAKAHLSGREYRYISPTFLHTKAGVVRRILRAALTNNPAIHELPALANAQAKGKQKMDEFEYLALCQELGLPKGTEPEKVLAAAKALKAGDGDDADKQAGAIKAVCSALGLGDDAKAEDITKAIAGLKSGAQPGDQSDPDPSEFVSMASYQQMAGQLKALQDQVTGDKAAQAVEKAMASGQVAPAQKNWAMSFASQDLDGFAEFLENQPVIVSPDSAVKGDAPTKASALDDEQKALCESLGVAEADFLKTLNEGVA